MRSTVVQLTVGGRANRREIIPTCTYMNALRLPACFPSQAVLRAAVGTLERTLAVVHLQRLSEHLESFRPDAKIARFISDVKLRRKLPQHIDNKNYKEIAYLAFPELGDNFDA